jgi:hypothetical protein
MLDTASIAAMINLSLDADTIRPQLIAILADPPSRKEILAWRGEPAQALINLLQTVGLHPRPKIRAPCID